MEVVKGETVRPNGKQKIIESGFCGAEALPSRWSTDRSIQTSVTGHQKERISFDFFELAVVQFSTCSHCHMPRAKDGGPLLNGTS